MEISLKPPSQNKAITLFRISADRCAGFMVDPGEIISAVVQTINRYQICDDTLLAHIDIYNRKEFCIETFRDQLMAVKKVLLPDDLGEDIEIKSDIGKTLLKHLRMSENGHLTYDHCFVGFISAAHSGIFDAERPYDDDIERRLQEAMNLASNELGEDSAVPVVSVGRNCFNIPMDDAMWFCRNMHIPFEEGRFHHLPIEHLMPFARKVLGEWRYAASSNGKDHIVERMQQLRWDMAIRISPVTNTSIMELRLKRIEWGSDSYKLFLEIDIFCLDDTLEHSLKILEITDEEYRYNIGHFEDFLKSQKRRNTAKWRAGGGWIMVDKVIGAYLLPLLLQMDQQSFDEMFMDFAFRYPTGTAKRDEITHATGIELPHPIQSITIKDGVMGGVVRISDDLTWRSGKMHWKGKLPSAMSTSIKGRPAREVIDSPLLEGMKISGSRLDPNGGHIFSLSNSQARYTEILTKPSE